MKTTVIITDFARTAVWSEKYVSKHIIDDKYRNYSEKGVSKIFKKLQENISVYLPEIVIQKVGPAKYSILDGNTVFAAIKKFNSVSTKYNRSYRVTLVNPNCLGQTGLDIARSLNSGRDNYSLRDFLEIYTSGRPEVTLQVKENYDRFKEFVEYTNKTLYGDPSKKVTKGLTVYRYLANAGSAAIFSQGKLNFTSADLSAAKEKVQFIKCLFDMVALERVTCNAASAVYRFIETGNDVKTIEKYIRKSGSDLISSISPMVSHQGMNVSEWLLTLMSIKELLEIYHGIKI